MSRGAFESLGDRIATALIIAPPDVARNAVHGARFLPGDHPVPGENSLRAGEALHRWVSELESELPLLVLLSGGGSALVEIPVPGLSLADLVRINRWLLASGLDIHGMNTMRARFSCLKRGGLLRLATGRPVDGLVISDVPGDRLEDIASGPLSPVVAHWPSHVVPVWLQNLHERLPLPSREMPAGSAQVRIIARNADAVDAIAVAVKDAGVSLQRREVLEGDAAEQGRCIARALRDSEPGVHVFGGETTVRLPPQPGKGGRNQQLALAAAMELAGCDDVLLLALGTDGIDGNTEDAGALIDGGSLQRIRDAGFDAVECLRRANSNAALAAAGDIINTGPTGTNVSDVVIGWKW